MAKIKVEAVRKLLETQGDKPEQIEATLDMIRIQENEKKCESLRSWVAVVTGVVALIVSILVAIYK